MFPLHLNPAQPEITDLIISHDPTTLDRLPVNKSQVLDTFANFHNLTRAISLPRTVVVDGGFIRNRGWAVIEFNAAWGAGPNGCGPEKVLPAIVSASAPLQTT